MSYKKILFRRDSAANWTSENPILSNGEVGLETDTDKIKIGDGSTAWTSLTYFYGSLENATLNQLDDVTYGSFASGQFLRWNGSAWVNDSSATASFTGAEIDAVRIGVTAAGEIDTTSGGLTIDSASGTTTVDDNLVVTGNLTVSGTTTTVNTWIRGTSQCDLQLTQSSQTLRHTPLVLLVQMELVSAQHLQQRRMVDL